MFVNVGNGCTLYHRVWQLMAGHWHCTIIHAEFVALEHGFYEELMRPVTWPHMLWAWSPLGPGMRMCIYSGYAVAEGPREGLVGPLPLFLCDFLFTFVYLYVRAKNNDTNKESMIIR